MSNMRILILGATGLLGRVLTEVWGSDSVIAAGSQEIDICCAPQLNKLYASSRPDVTILAAAYTDVDGCEEDPKLAHAVNCRGAINVAQASRQFGSRLLFISTDYVFDGTKTIAYEPEDEVCPINVYGASKANAEHGIQEVLPECCIVRTSWLFGAGKRCFPNTILESAERRRHLKVVDDQKGCPTFNRDLARAIVGLVRASARGIIHVTNRDACNWYEFACALVEAAGLKGITIRPIDSDQFPSLARRPAFSVLSNASLGQHGISMRPWKQTLGDYFADRHSLQDSHHSNADGGMNKREGK